MQRQPNKPQQNKPQGKKSQQNKQNKPQQNEPQQTDHNKQNNKNTTKQYTETVAVIGVYYIIQLFSINSFRPNYANVRGKSKNHWFT